MQARVQDDGEYSEPFLVTNGVKQGCVMAPTLFSMMFSTTLTDAFQDVDAGFQNRYRFDGKLLNLRSMQAKSNVQTDVVDKLLYADDLAENAKSEKKMMVYCQTSYMHVRPRQYTNAMPRNLTIST